MSPARFLVALCSVAQLSVAPSASAQDRIAEGRVNSAAADGRPIPVPRQWVVLHRVGNDRSAPLDSTRTDANGRYRIRYRLFGDPEAIYFVSARYAGIAYFSPPLRVPVVRGGDADVQVYETTTDTTLLRVQGRHLVASAPTGKSREIAEIFEIENAGFRTIVARDSTVPVWSTMLPARAESTSVGPGDLNLSAVRFRNGRAEIFSPISPGVRQLVLTYQLDPRSFPVSLPIASPVSVLEVLLEEPRAVVEGARLAEVSPATVGGRMFRRFLAQDVPGASVMRVTAPPPVEQNQGAIKALVVVAALALILGFGAWAMRRGGNAVADPLAASVADVLLAELATLDARAGKELMTADERRVYEEQRALMKGRIARALAGAGTPG
ncbi:MAG: hypothetical protein ACRENU_13295 [Gemmatimonadaceae bacterium]